MTPEEQAAFDELAKAVEETVGVEESAIVLIDGFAARLAAAGTDPVKLKALSDSLAAEKTKLAASVAANQPA